MSSSNSTNLINDNKSIKVCSTNDSDILNTRTKPLLFRSLFFWLKNLCSWESSITIGNSLLPLLLSTINP